MKKLENVKMYSIIKKVMTFAKTTLLSFLFLTGTISLYAQNVAMADLQQDMALLKREVGQLRLEVEQLSRENSELKRQINAAKNSGASSDSVRAQVSSVRSEVSSQTEALKREIIAQVKKDIQALTSQTNEAIEKLAKAIGERPQAPMPKTFGSDFPQTGFTYTVKSGDTIGKIARANNSKIKWILDANKISDPAKIQVGDSIFIPQN